MRKIYIFTIFILLFNISLEAMKDLPPVPSPGIKEKKRKALRECKVPPQIAILPPQIDADYRDCVNGYYEPDPVNVKAKLKQIDGNAQFVSVKPAQGYMRAYEITFETLENDDSFFSFGKEKKITKILLCNDTLSNCYKVEQTVVSDEKKK
jgi:hypothetical protein